MEKKQNVKWTSLNSLKKPSSQINSHWNSLQIYSLLFSFFWTLITTEIQTKNANSKQFQWANDILLKIIYLIFNYTLKSFERQRQEKEEEPYIAYYNSKWRLALLCAVRWFFLFICHILANELISSEWLIQVHSAFSQLYCFFNAMMSPFDVGNVATAKKILIHFGRITHDFAHYLFVVWLQLVL